MIKNQDLICQFDNCFLYLSNPVTLPCGFTICRKHLGQINLQQECPFCIERHQNLSDLKINETLDQMITINNSHLNGLQLKCKQTLDKIFMKLDEIEYFNLDELLVDHFEWLRNDLQKKYIKQINNLNNSNQISEANKKVIKYELNLRLKELQVYLDNIEVECTENFDEWIEEVEKRCLDDEELVELNKMNLDLKIPDLYGEILSDLLIRLSSILIRLESHFNELKNRVFMNKFFKIDENLGCLNVTDELAYDCGKLINCLHDTPQDSFQINEDRVLSVLIVENLNLIITGSGHDENENLSIKLDTYRIKLWSMNSGELKEVITGAHFGPIGCIIHDLERKIFLTGSYDGTMCIFDLITFRKIKTFTFKDGIIRMCLLPNSRLACLRFNGEIRVYDFNDIFNLKRIKKFKEFSDVNVHGYSCLELTSDMDQLIGCNDNDFVCVWDSKAFNLIAKIESVKTAKSMPISNSILLLNANNTLELISFVKKKAKFERRILTSIDLNTNFDLIGFEVNLMIPLSDKVIALNDHDEIFLFDLEKRIKVLELNGHTKVLNCLYFSTNSGYLATGSDDQTIRLWKIF